MKKLIFFLCRMPGIFLVTVPIVGTSLLMHRNELDDRFWLPIMFSLMMTVAANFYLFFVQGEKTGDTVKGSKWVGIIVIGVLTIINVCHLILLKAQPDTEFPAMYAVQSVISESMFGVLVWAWFALLWNMNVSSYSPVYEAIEQTQIKRSDRLLDELKELQQN
jgi:hypothetical protein